MFHVVRSALSVILSKINGQTIGEGGSVSRMIKDIFKLLNGAKNELFHKASFFVQCFQVYQNM